MLIRNRLFHVHFELKKLHELKPLVLCWIRALTRLLTKTRNISNSIGETYVLGCALRLDQVVVVVVDELGWRLWVSLLLPITSLFRCGRFAWIFLNLRGSRYLAPRSLSCLWRLLGLHICQRLLGLATNGWLLLVDVVRAHFPRQEKLPLALFVFQKIDALRLIIAPFLKFWLVRARMLRLAILNKFLDLRFVSFLGAVWGWECFDLIRV